MQRKILLSYFVIILLAIGISAATFWNTGYEHIKRNNDSQYLRQAELISDIFSTSELKKMEDYKNFVNHYGDKYNVRITIIDRDGEVVADSDASGELENHGNREEVRKALNGEKNSIIRYSQTLGMDYSYSAIPITGNDNFSGVLRISLPLSEMKAFQRDINTSIMWTVIVCFIVAVLTAFVFAQVLSRPVKEITRAAERISSGDYDIKIYTREKSQIARLASAFNTMAVNLKETIRNLTQRKTELEVILGSISGGVIAINDANRILFFNHSFISLMGLGKKDIKGNSIYSILRNVAIYDVIDQVREMNQEVKAEGTGIRPGQIISITGTPLVTENQGSSGVLLIIEDISQIKKLENIRTDFVSNVTHELKTPLTSIRGFIDTLRNGNVNDKETANKFLDIIDIEAERLSRLIQDILLLSEIESKENHEMVFCDINKIAREVINLLEPKLTDKVHINFEPQPYIRPFLCNPDRIKELLINLIDNGMKYTEEGAITVVCKEENQNMVIQVKDTGIGIEKEHLHRIFERFYRIDKGRSRKKGGTGLGLSIVKHIVQLYDGNIEVKSEVGVGTEFYITLPYRRGE